MTSLRALVWTALIVPLVASRPTAPSLTRGRRSDSSSADGTARRKGSRGALLHMLRRRSPRRVSYGCETTRMKSVADDASLDAVAPSSQTQ